MKFKNTLEGEVIEFSGRIASFFNHFLGMVEIYQNIDKQDNLKSKLKISWRWVKNVVKEWHFYQKEISNYK